MLAALILAAGFSSRMGAFKPLLPLPFAHGTLNPVQALCALYHTAGVDTIIVVSGHRAAEVEACAHACNARTVRNRRPEDGMFSSVCAGLDSLAEVTCSHLFVHPVDVPLVRHSTVRALLKAAQETPEKVLIPSYAGEEGHPPLFPSIFLPVVRQWSGEQGLHGALQTLPRMTVALADDTILFDMDTDSAYQEACLKAHNMHIS